MRWEHPSAGLRREGSFRSYWGTGVVSGGYGSRWLPPACKCQGRDKTAVPLPGTRAEGGGGGEHHAALRGVSRSQAAVVQLPTCLYLLLILTLRGQQPQKHCTWDTQVANSRNGHASVANRRRFCGSNFRALHFSFLPSWNDSKPVMAVAEFPSMPWLAGQCPGPRHQGQPLGSKFTSGPTISSAPCRGSLYRNKGNAFLSTVGS